MKKIISLTLVFFALVGCSRGGGDIATSSQTVEQANRTRENLAEEESDTTMENAEVKVIIPNGTPALSMVKMITETPTISEGISVTYELVESTDVLSTTLINNDADIAIVPTNLAATLYNKGTNYKLVGTSVWGILYIATTEDISTLEDLKGKRVGAIGRDLTPDALFRYILNGNNIDTEDDLTLEYFSGAPELASNFIAGEIDTVIAPEPLLTSMLMKRKEAFVAINLQDEWEKLTGFESYPQASLIVNTSLIESNPEFVSKFINNYDESVSWVNDNPLVAGVNYEKLGIGLNTKILEPAIPNCSLDFITATEAKSSIQKYLKILFEFNPKLLGGVMVDEGFYFE
ncbi:MAG: ABC transporter substrate-binding protein [Lachnospirales bacterium]